jgi:hypothetical protein
MDLLLRQLELSAMTWDVDPSKKIVERLPACDPIKGSAAREGRETGVMRVVVFEGAVLENSLGIALDF